MEPEWIVLAVGLLTLAAGVALGVKAKRTARPSVVEASGTAAVQRTVATNPVPPNGLFEESLDGRVVAGDTLVVPHPNDSRLLLVFGAKEHAAALGEVVGGVPQQLATVVVGADALLKAGIAAGERGGMLVRLTRESSKAFQSLNKIDAGGGAVMGVLRDGGGQFRHIVKFRPVSGLQAVASLGNVLSAVAMQAQLAAIERKLEQVVHAVRQVQSTLEIQARAKQASISRVLGDIYRGAHGIGVLTQAAWDQVAPLGREVEERIAYSRERLEELLKSLNEQRSTGARHRWLKENRDSLLQAVDQVLLADQTQLQFHALRLWWLSTTGDPSLGYYQSELAELPDRQEHQHAMLRSRLTDALSSAEETWWFDYVHSPLDSRRMRDGVHQLWQGLAEAGLVEAPASPGATPQTAIVDALSAEAQSPGDAAQASVRGQEQ